jgi:DNA polymerase (family 10)
LENDEILRPLRLTAQLLELHDENPFKIRSYQNAVIALERVNDNLADLPPAQLAAIQGVGKSIAGNIAAIREGGSFPELENLVAKTPEGVLDMLRIKGIGPKKVRTLWRELGVETTDTLLQACEENRVAQLKGFGEKTQENIKQALLFTRQAAGKLHYAEAEAVAGGLLQRLRDAGIQAGPAGQLARKNDIVDTLQLLTAAPNPAAVHGLLDGLPGLRRDDRTTAPFSWRGTLEGSEMPLEVLIARPEKFVNQSFICSAAPDHLRYRDEKGHTLLQIALHGKFEAEEAIYAQAGLPYIIPELREGLFEFDLVKAGKLGNLVRSEDLKGILHNHSTYSDGRHTLAEMANYCKELGYQYLGISDHSKSAYYAGGLTEEFVAKQHREIDELNKQLAPFRIFKGIESDILNDGSLDYDNDVLASFDFIVASVHSNLKMDEAKATARLIRAVENPYTTILGHPTGRLLLRREGYPIDHQKVIDACAANEVIIEINANPWRLDIDWHWLPYALNKGVLISINPDAHEKAGYHDMQYGVHVARKGGLPVDMTFNAWPLDQVEAYLKAKKG